MSDMMVTLEGLDATSRTADGSKFRLIPDSATLQDVSKVSIWCASQQFCERSTSVGSSSYMRVYIIQD